MTITQHISIDLQQPGNAPMIHAVQGDEYARVAEIDLYSGGVAWNPPSGCEVAIRYGKPDGKGGIYDKLPDNKIAWSISSNTVTVILAPQMLTVAGIVNAQVEIIVNEKEILSTFHFIVDVEEDASMGAIKSENYANWKTYYIPQTYGAKVGQYLKISNVDADGRVVAVAPVDSPSGGNGGMTTAQINALHGMFKVCVFDDTKDVDGAISAFETAFGITGGGEVPDQPEQPDQPGGGSGGTTADALPTNGLMAYFDLRNLGDKANVTVGTTKGVMATQGSGALFSWASQPITSSNEYGVKADRLMMFSAEGNTTQTDLGTEFTVISFGFGESICPGIQTTNVNPSWQFMPSYNKTDGTAKADVTDGSVLNGDNMKDYNYAVYRVSGATLTLINDTSRKDYNGNDYEGFVSWDSKPGLGRTHYNRGYGTAVAIYNRALSDVEIEEARAFMKTLEVTA